MTYVRPRSPLGGLRVPIDPTGYPVGNIASLSDAAWGGVLGDLTAQGLSYSLSPSDDATGVSDLANIKALARITGRAHLSGGIFYINAALPLSSQGQSITGMPSGVNKTTFPPAAKPTLIYLVNGSNSDMVDVTAANCYIGDIEFVGNGSNQSGGTALINVEAAGVGTIIQRCLVRDGYADGIATQPSGEAVKILDCWLEKNGSYGIYINSSDCTIRGTLVGESTSDNIYVNAAVTHIIDCDIYSGTLNGINISTNGTGTMITNCGIDRNMQCAIYGNGAEMVIMGNTIHSNSQQTNAGYPSIKIEQGSGTLAAIYGNTFWLDSGYTNLPSYHIYYSAMGTAKAAGNIFQASSYATGTINVASMAADTNETA